MRFAPIFVLLSAFSFGAVARVIEASIDVRVLPAVNAKQQQPPPPEAYPGQREHKEPPPGWFCSREPKDKTHKCTCKRMGHTDEHGCCGEPTTEDQACLVWCHKDRCACEVTCDTPDSPHAQHEATK